MATTSTIEVKMSGRPCLVLTRHNGQRKAFCHLFTTRAHVIAPSPLKGGHTGGQISEPVAVVEFEDGTVEAVALENIHLLDTAAEMEKYDWKTRPNTEGAE